MVVVFLADGFEEIEALTPVDVLRRGGVEVKTVGIGSSEVCGSHGILVKCDMRDNELDKSKVDAVILPGGMPGTLNLKNSKTVTSLIKHIYDNGGLVAAICAAPSVLGSLGILNGRVATCYPGFEDELKGAEIKQNGVCIDGNVITAKGPGVSLDFSFAVLNFLKGDSTASKEIRESMQCVR